MVVGFLIIVALAYVDTWARRRSLAPSAIQSRGLHSINGGAQQNTSEDQDKAA
jgi:hypothetical protein